MKVTNLELNQMLESLEPLLERKDILGYLAAMNTKILREKTAEFNKFKDELVREYGEHDMDEDGNELPTISIFPGYENWDKYVERMEPILCVEQDFTPVTTSYESAMGVLTGQQILELDWMFAD